MQMYNWEMFQRRLGLNGGLMERWEAGPIVANSSAEERSVVDAQANATR